MTSVARVLGAVCLVLAAVVAGLGIYGFVEGVSVTAGSDEVRTFSREAAGIYLVATLSSALVLATIGATAIVAADAGAQAKKAARAADRLSRDHRPPPPAFAPMPQAPAASQLPSPQDRHSPSLQRQPASDGQSPEDGRRWGPPIV